MCGRWIEIIEGIGSWAIMRCSLGCWGSTLIGCLLTQVKELTMLALKLS